ncbi:uncharacterized protein RCO7_01475 [Rhynchosporium graminicola]|uniref:BTB domain-containing protein n=1 Tax=Rhynchosporium graminicola TaxID=2792576 RepID=A0A1E1JZI3_9HELO|nr:uncharacterized protein RCO7_01475 [Rhynchosporium commune]
MNSRNSTPDSTPPFSSSLTTMDAPCSAQKASSQASISSPIARSMSHTPGPESSQQQAQLKKKKAPSLRRPQSVVTIFIGPEESKETFTIHKDINCHYSNFFAKAFGSTSMRVRRKL